MSMVDSPTAAQQLIEGCQGLVRSLAIQVQKKLPSCVELDDLIADGQIGLAEAARDFDPTRGAKFSTYAYYRIRGAIYDGLNRMSWTGRARHREIHYEQLANDVLRLENEYEGEGDNSSVEADWTWLQNVSGALAVIYLSTRADDEEGQPFEPSDELDPGPELTAMTREIREKLRQLVDSLPAEAAALIRAVYYEDHTLEESGRKIGVSKSWASRLHARTLSQLARSLRAIGVSS